MTKYTITFFKEENIYRVENPNGGPRLSYSAHSGVRLIEIQDGEFIYAFKDLNKNGRLDPYEDWRLNAETRARDLVNRLTFDRICGLMHYPVGEPEPDGSISEMVENQLSKLGIRFLLCNRSNKNNGPIWNNAIQAKVEKEDPLGIPVNIASDPRNTIAGGRFVVFEDSDMSGWPGNLGLAATFDPEYALKHGQVASCEYRAFGIGTALSPQIDLATEPRWSRFGGTFGEGSKLSIEMAKAYVAGFQSTWLGIGSSAQDQGWGNDSVSTMIKHFPSDGAAEGGREAHNNFGKYNVYPGDNLSEHCSVFSAAMSNDISNAGPAASVMPSYSIAMSTHGPIGRPVGSSYSVYKLTELLRKQLKFKGLICSDWDITFDKVWGTEDQGTLERHYGAIKAGLNMFGGSNDVCATQDAFEFGLMAEKLYLTLLPGMPENYVQALKRNYKDTDYQAVMKKRYNDSAAACIKTSFQNHLFENPYVIYDESKIILKNPEFRHEAMDAQLASVVMLKNSKGLIVPNENKKRTIYIPLTYVPAIHDFMLGDIPAQIRQYLGSCENLSKYFNIVTDSVKESADRNSPEESDIIHRTNFTGVDFALISLENPHTGHGYRPDKRNLNPAKGPIDNGYYPISLQFRPYYADPHIVREYPIGIDPNEEIEWIAAGGQRGKSRYYGRKTVVADNESQLDEILSLRKRVGNIPILVCINMTGPMCVYEFEPHVDGILVGFSISEAAMLEVIAGNYEPQGLLPMQIPASMETVEQQLEDVPFDMSCYVDKTGNIYDYGYGLDYSGIISDWRTKKYGREAYTQLKSSRNWGTSRN